MRPLRRLRQADSKQTQSSIRQKQQKEKETLISLMDLPDCDVTEFFQQLMKNKNYEKMLDEISDEKKIDFFAKNYTTFLQTQDELLSMKMPTLSQIPRAKEFHLKLKQEAKSQQDGDEAAVIEIIDSFSTHVLQKNTEQVMRIYKIILEMKEHSRYREHFYSYSINKIFRESYTSFVQNCQDFDTLMKLNETVPAIRVFFEEKETKMFQKINGDLNIDSSVISLKRTLSYLLKQIDQYSQQFKIKFMKQIQKQPELALYLSHWINKLALSYYQSIEPLIYQQEEISDILKNLSEILETSKETQSKGISLYRELRNHISADLPSHLQKIMEVVLDSFDDLLKYNNDLYEFIQVKELNAIPYLIDQLNLITKKDYGKKCCSKKGILLINSFLVILLPLCDEKWAFLHENVLQSIIDKVKTMMEQEKVKLPMWDYYHLFMFFYQLGQGKVRHRILFDSANSSYLKEKITKIKRLADDCRFVFENSLIQSLWTEILSLIPELLWQFKKYAESQQRANPKPTVFSISLVFSLEQFFKQLQFRLSKQHYEYLGIQFYEYIFFVIQYVIFWSYHDKGQNTKVFTLYKKQQKLLTKAKQMFPIQELTTIKNKQILKLSYFTKHGLERLVVDLYFLSDVYKILLNGCQKIKGDEFLFKVSRILAKQLKNEPLQTDRKQYQELLRQFINVYENQPQVIKKYMNERRAVSSKPGQNSQKTVNNSSSRSNQKRYIEDDDN